MVPLQIIEVAPHLMNKAAKCSIKVAKGLGRTLRGRQTYAVWPVSAGRHLPQQPIEGAEMTRRKSSTLILAVRRDFFALVAVQKV
jgi:hypothetical protein